MIRAGVIGSGPAAEAHVRAFAALRDRCLLVGLHDADATAAEDVARRHGTAAYHELLALLRAVEVVVIASDPVRRPEHVRAAVITGCDVLIEPPAGPSPEDVASLRSIVPRSERPQIIAIGHSGHFHPVVRELRNVLAGQALVALRTERLEPWDGRYADQDPVMGLMLHDIHVVQSIAHRSVAATQAAGRQMRRGGPVDHAVATLVFEDDLIATLSAGRAGGEPVHRICATTSAGEVVADLLAGTLETRRTTLAADGRRETVAQRVAPPPTDPHVAQAAAFLRSVEERMPPDIGLGMGVEVLETASSVAKRVALIANRPAMRSAPRAA